MCIRGSWELAMDYCACSSTFGMCTDPLADGSGNVHERTHLSASRIERQPSLRCTRSVHFLVYAFIRSGPLLVLSKTR